MEEIQNKRAVRLKLGFLQTVMTQRPASTQLTLENDDLEGLYCIFNEMIDQLTDPSDDGGGG